MGDPRLPSELRDETALRWSFLESEPDPCVVVSERMELVYLNEPAHRLVPGEWFGKRCFEVLPTVDETCAFHCDKMRAVNESVDVVYCEETVGSAGGELVLGVGLIPLDARTDDPARAVLLLRDKTVPVLRHQDDVEHASEFEAHVLRDAEKLRARIAREHPARPGTRSAG